jgi:hypothetical protein
MALESTQSLTEMSTRNLPGGKGRPAGRRVRLTISAPSASRLSGKCGNVSQAYGSPRPVTGILLSFTFLTYFAEQESSNQIADSPYFAVVFSSAMKMEQIHSSEISLTSARLRGVLFHTTVLFLFNAVGILNPAELT